MKLKAVYGIAECPKCRGERSFEYESLDWDHTKDTEECDLCVDGYVDVTFHIEDLIKQISEGLDMDKAIKETMEAYTRTT